MKRILLFTLLLLLGAGGFFWWHRHSGTNGHLGFRTTAIEHGDLTATISATGTLEPEEVVDVGAQVAGRIDSFGVDPSNSAKTVDYNTEVKKGDILAEI